MISIIKYQIAYRDGVNAALHQLAFRSLENCAAQRIL